MSQRPIWCGGSQLALVLRTPLIAATVLAFALGWVPLAYPQGAATVTLTVRVTDATTEMAVERARVELVRFPDGVFQQVFTDGSGLAEFYRLTPQRYLVRAHMSGYEPAEISVDVIRGDISNKSASIAMQRIRAATVSPADASTSARALAVPEAAREEFQKGVRALNEKKSAQKSLEHFQRAVGIWPEYSEAYFLLGMAHLQLHSAHEAETALKKSAELDSKFLSPYYPLAVLFISQKRYDEAESLLLKALEMDRQGWQWPFELARCNAMRGQWDKALTYGQMAHNRPNAPTKVHILMADLYSNTGNPDTALEELQEFAKLDPNSPLMPKVQRAIAELRKRQF